MILLTFQNFNYVKDYYSPPNTFMLDVTDIEARPRSDTSPHHCDS